MTTLGGQVSVAMELCGREGTFFPAYRPRVIMATRPTLRTDSTISIHRYWMYGFGNLHFTMVEGMICSFCVTGRRLGNGTLRTCAEVIIRSEHDWSTSRSALVYMRTSSRVLFTLQRFCNSMFTVYRHRVLSRFSLDVVNRLTRVSCLRILL